MRRQANLSDFSGHFHDADDKKIRVERDLLNDDTLIQCNDCLEFSTIKTWMFQEDGMYCETCGSHDAVICPKCNEAHDYLMTHFYVKKF